MEDRTLLQSEVPDSYPPAGDATRVMTPAPAAPYGAPYGGYGDQTQQAITITCPVCNTPNGPGERYCQDCGLMFGSAGEQIEAMPDASQLPRLTDPSGREFILNPGANSVGRDSADVLIPDTTVSRRHAQLTLEGGQIIVEDFGSTNGTSVSGRKLAPGQREAALNGDKIKFGNVILDVTIPGGASAAPAPAAAAPEAAAPVDDRGPALGYLTLADGSERPLFVGVNVMGRRSTNQIVIADAFASGKHAEINVDADGAAHLVDLGSTNGTFVDGNRLAPQTPVFLTNGGGFAIGKAQVTYRRVGSAEPESIEQTLMASPVESDQEAAAPLAEESV